MDGVNQAKWSEGITFCVYVAIYDLYCYVWYQFLRHLKLGLSQFLTNTETNLDITFNKFYISTCIITSLIKVENVNLIALTDFEI